MDIETREIGQTGLKVSVLGIGGAPLGGNFATVEQGDAIGVVSAGFNAGLTYVDTAPFYGYGRSERAVGNAIRGRNYVLSTKVGRLLAPGAHPDPAPDGMVDPLPFHPSYDYSYDGIMRSYEDSQQRLGLDRIDILLVHDIGKMQHGAEGNAHHFAALANGGYRALDKLRASGQIKAIGLGVNEAAICRDALKIGDWDTFLLAGRYTLLEQDPLDDLIPACQARGITLIVGGPFNSGVLVGRKMWNYATAPEHVIAKVKRLAEVCADHAVQMPVAALQLPLAHPVVAAIIPGARSASEMHAILNWAATPTPPALWSDLKGAGLLHENTVLPDGKAILRPK